MKTAPQHFPSRRINSCNNEPKGGTYGARVSRQKVTNSRIAILNTTENSLHNSPVAADKTRPGLPSRGIRPYQGYWDLRETKSRRLNTIGRPYQRTPNFISPELRLVARRARGLWAWHNRCIKLARRKLTTRGTPRQRRYFSEESPATRAARIQVESRLRMQRLRAARHALNLTSAGTKRQRAANHSLNLLTPLETDYRLFRAAIARPTDAEDVFVDRNQGIYK